MHQTTYFCDRCGTKCVNKVFRINGYVQHYTNGPSKELVGEDMLQGTDLCSACQEEFATFMGSAFRLDNSSPVGFENTASCTAISTGPGTTVFGPVTEDGRPPEVASDPHP